MALACDPETTDKNTLHSYLPAYQVLFGPLRDAARHVLEIGIHRGGSIRMWHDFFPNALITGVDVDARASANVPDSPRVRVVIGDAYSDAALQALSSCAYDILIDDGPHTLESQCYFAREYARFLAPGGVLVIEDVQNMDWIPALHTALPEHLRPHARTIDLRGVKGRYDDILFIVTPP